MSKTKIKKTTNSARRISTAETKAAVASVPTASQAVSPAMSLLDELNFDPPLPVSVDVSAFFSRPADNPVVLEWRFPSVVNLYRVEDTARRLERVHQLPIGAARDMAMMAACHIAPDPGAAKASDFYAKIATDEGHQRFWFYLVGQLGIHFPELRPMPAPVAAPAPIEAEKTEAEAAPPETTETTEATKATLESAQENEQENEQENKAEAA